MKTEINGNTFEVENDVQFWQNISTWEPYSFEILDRFLKDGGNFVDVGAWNGVLSIYGARRAAQVFSFEPDKLAYEHFVNNIKLNGIKNIEAFNAAASFEAGIKELFIKHDGDSVSSLVDRTMEGYVCGKHYEVVTVGLVKFLSGKENISLIKIDIEGFEEKLLPEMASYFEKQQPTLYISFHPGWFEDKEKSVEKIIATLAPHYNCFNVHFEKHSYDEFKKSLDGKGHCFIFVKK